MILALRIPKAEKQDVKDHYRRCRKMDLAALDNVRERQSLTRSEAVRESYPLVYRCSDRGYRRQKMLSQTKSKRSNKDNNK